MFEKLKSNQADWKGRPLRVWIADKARVFLQPPYSSEFNPVEKLWGMMCDGG